MIGILLLMGITKKKNSIILVQHANHLRSEKRLSAAEDMLDAGPIRLRPISMSTAATMMAAVLSELGLGAGS